MIAACSLVSFSPTRTARASSERSKRQRASRPSNPSASRAIQPLLESQPFQGILIAPPVRSHLHNELEKNLAPEQAFDLGTRARAYRLDHASTLADKDALLGIRLDVEAGPDAGFLQLLYLDTDRGRHLVAGAGAGPL